MTSSHSPAPRSDCSTRSRVSTALMPLSRRPAATLSKIDIVGNGLGFWKTMPIARRTADDVDVVAVDVVVVEAAPRPSARAPGISSCMRLMQRTSVDLPQPDGPIIAVTCSGA